MLIYKSYYTFIIEQEQINFIYDTNDHGNFTIIEYEDKYHYVGDVPPTLKNAINFWQKINDIILTEKELQSVISYNNTTLNKRQDKMATTKKTPSTKSTTKKTPKKTATAKKTPKATAKKVSPKKTSKKTTTTPKKATTPKPKKTAKPTAKKVVKAVSAQEQEPSPVAPKLDNGVIVVAPVSPLN